MRTSEQYLINGRFMTSRTIATECHCSVTTVYNHWDSTRGTDQEKFDSLKIKIQKKCFVDGYITLQQVSQKAHIDRTTIYSFLKSTRGSKYHTEILKGGEHLQPQLMVRFCDLYDIIRDAKEYVRNASDMAEKRNANKIAKEKNTSKKNIEQLKIEHPLVKDVRFFELSFFPEINTYRFLTECNYTRQKAEKK